MIKASNPVVKDGVGILARLVVIALLLSILSALLQGCAGNAPKDIITETEISHRQIKDEILHAGEDKMLIWMLS